MRALEASIGPRYLSSSRLRKGSDPVELRAEVIESTASIGKAVHRLEVGGDAPIVGVTAGARQLPSTVESFPL